MSNYAVALVWKKYDLTSTGLSIEEVPEIIVIEANTHAEALGSGLIRRKANGYVLSTYATTEILNTKP